MASECTGLLLPNQEHHKRSFCSTEACVLNAVVSKPYAQILDGADIYAMKDLAELIELQGDCEQ